MAFRLSQPAREWPELAGIPACRQGLAVQRPEDPTAIGGRQREMATYVRSYCEPIYAIVSLVEIGFCYALVDLQQRQLGYARALVSIFCVGVLIRLVQYLQLEGGLLAGLRAIPGSPMARFIIILFASYLALVLGISATVTWTQQPHVSAETMKKIAISLTSLADVKNRIVPGPLSVKLHALTTMSFNDVLLSVSTLLFYFVLFKSIIRFKDFGRKDEDYASVAQILVTRGKYQEALQELQKIGNITSQQEFLKAAPNLALGKIDRAYALTERWIQGREDTETVTPENVYSLLFLTGFTNYSLPAEAMVELFRAAQKDKCQDSSLAASVMGAALLGQISTADCRLAFPAGTEDTYPISHAAILIAEGKPEEALEMFKRSTSQTPADQVMKMSYVFIYGLPGEVKAGRKAADVAAEWLANNLEHYRALCDACTENWNEELVLGLVAPMCTLSSELAPLPERFKELRTEIAQRIRAKPGGVERGSYLDEMLVAAEQEFG
jgi:tetratricopeptide (TPR) repeat protein